MSNETTTTNLADFGWRERKLAAELLMVSCDQGFPSDFEDEGVQLMFNRNNGNVFFVNDKYQIAMMNGDKLESFYYTPYHSYEGFADELLEMYNEDKDNWNQKDIEFLKDIGILTNEDDSEKSLD